MPPVKIERMPVTIGVIPAAGFGTRFLPASKVVPKELIPVVDRPIIQYAVEELVRAGITDICLVISRGKESVAEHFRPARPLESALEKSGKRDLLDHVTRLNSLANIEVAYQDEPRGLGHAVGAARDVVGSEPFAALLPDELFDPQENFMAEMIAAFEKERVSVTGAMEVPNSEIMFYGAVASDDLSSEPINCSSVVEKPDPAEAPSNLALIGRYVMVPEIFEIIESVQPGAGGEIQLTDALNVLAARGELRAVRYRGRRWDAGKKDSYLQAVATLALEDPELGRGFREFLGALLDHDG